MSPSSRPGCSKPHSLGLEHCQGIGHPQLLWGVTCSSVPPPSQQRISFEHLVQTYPLSLKPFLLIPSLHSCVKSPMQLCCQPPSDTRNLKGLPEAFFFPRWTVPARSACLHRRGLAWSSPVIIWTHSSRSTSVLCWRPQAWMEYSLLVRCHQRGVKESPPSTCCLEMIVLVHFATSPLLLCYFIGDLVLESTWFAYWYNSILLGKWGMFYHVFCMCVCMKMCLCVFWTCWLICQVWEKDKGLEIAEFLELLLQQMPVSAGTREPTQELSHSFTTQKTSFIFCKLFLLNLNAVED